MKNVIVSVKSDLIKIGALFLCVLLLFSLSVGYASADARKVPVYRVERQDKAVALTFDAAWGADKTRAILDALDRYEAKATFFLVDFWTEKYPDLAREIVARGHAVGSHSVTHPHFNKLTSEQTAKEINQSAATIEAVTGERVKFFRFPFGEYNNAAIAHLERQGIIPVQWDVDSLDWKGISASEISERILKGAKSGSIILCHNNSDHVLEALDNFIPKMQADGFCFLRLLDVCYTENYTVDQNGIQKPIG